MAAHTTSCSEVSSGGVTISLCRGGTARRSHLPPGQARSAPLRRLPQPSADPPTDSAGHGRTPTPTRSRTTPATAAPPRTTPCRPFNRRTSRRCRSPGAGTPGRQVPYPACRGSASAAGTHMGHRSPMHTALPMGEWRSDDIGTWPGSRRTAWISRAVGESWREGHRGHHRSDRVTSGRPRRVPRVLRRKGFARHPRPGPPRRTGGAGGVLRLRPRLPRNLRLPHRTRPHLAAGPALHPHRPTTAAGARRLRPVEPHRTHRRCGRGDGGSARGADH